MSRRRSRVRYSAAGTCASCPAPATDGCTTCRPCRRRAAAAAARRRQRLRELGLCVRCELPTEGWLCAVCSETANERARENYQRRKLEAAGRAYAAQVKRRQQRAAAR